MGAVGTSGSGYTEPRRVPVICASVPSSSSWKRVSRTAGCGADRRWWYQYPPVPRASDESLVASHTWVTCPRSRLSDAPGPPIRVGTQPGSTALLGTPGHSRATAAARVVTKSLLSEYEP